MYSQDAHWKFQHVTSSRKDNLEIHEDEIVRKFLSWMEALCLSGTHMIPENVFSDMTAPFTGSRLKSLLVNTKLSGVHLKKNFSFFCCSRS